MLKLPFLSKKEEPKEAVLKTEGNIVAIDIGTEALKTLLFSIDPLGVTIHKVSHIKQQQHAMSKGVINNLNTVLENCELAIREISEGLTPEELPDRVVMGLAGESIQGVSIIVNYDREENYDKEVTLDEQDRIVEKVHQQIAQSGKEDLARRTGLVNEDIEILHITVTGMEIGGMNVDSLVGFKGKSVRLYFYASFAPKTYIESLRKVSQELRLDMLGVVAQPFAVARAYAGGRNKDFSGIFVDIGGGTTDVAVVKNGNVMDTQIFGFGGRVFTKEIANAMKLDYRHAESRKLKYTENTLESKLQQEVRAVTYPTAQLWMRALEAALEEVKDIDVFPSQIFLCGGGALLPDIKNVMMEYPWTKLLPFATVPKVNVFLPERLDGIIDKSGDLKHAYDITPAGLARFAYDKLKNPDNYYITVTTNGRD